MKIYMYFCKNILQFLGESSYKVESITDHDATF